MIPGVVASETGGAQTAHGNSPSAVLRIPVILDGQAQFPAVHGAANAKTQLQVVICQTQQHLDTQVTQHISTLL